MICKSRFDLSNRLTLSRCDLDETRDGLKLKERR